MAKADIWVNWLPDEADKNAITGTTPEIAHEHRDLLITTHYSSKQYYHTIC